MTQIAIISVIVPSYNQAEYLDECLQSVFNQTYKNWECIIIDDGSTDKTEEISKSWVDKDRRFKYLYQKNAGVSAARNNGIKNACGKYILPLDGDDKISEEYMELALNVFDKNPKVGLVYAKAKMFGDINEYWDLIEFDKKHILYYNMIYCSAIFKKKYWYKVGGYDEKLLKGFEDWEYWINIIYNNKFKIVRLDYIGFHYRRKIISRDVVINNDSESKKEIYKYIQKKHWIHYITDRIKDKIHRTIKK